MALFYTRTFLKAFSTSSTSSRICPELWRSLTQLGISKRKPTRRGCRSGKQTTIENILEKAPRTAELLSSYQVKDSSAELQEGTCHLHNSSSGLLNIQIHTFCEENINTSKNGYKPQEKSIATNYNVPKLLLSNVRSLVPKIDEIREFISRNKVHFAFITETWLRSSISDGVVSIPNFAVIRKDRQSDSHGGVCAYINEEQCKHKVLDELHCCESHEILWLHLRPNRLPRGFSCIIAAVVYHPPGSDGEIIRDHLFQSLTRAEARYPNCGI